MQASVPRLLRRVGRFALSARVRRDAWHEWQRRLGGEPALPPPPLDGVLVLCHGNLCRSPYAAERLADRLPHLQVVSGGLAAAGGDPADAAARRVAAARGVSLEDHRTRRTVGADVEAANLVLVMEGHQASEIARRWPGSERKTRLLGAFLERPPFGIEDPWGTPDENFDAVFTRIDEAVESLALRIEALQTGSRGSRP